MQGILKILNYLFWYKFKSQKNIYIIAIIFTFSNIDILETEEYNKTKVNTINPMSKSK